MRNFYINPLEPEEKQESHAGRDLEALLDQPAICYGAVLHET